MTGRKIYAPISKFGMFRAVGFRIPCACTPDRTHGIGVYYFTVYPDYLTDKYSCPECGQSYTVSFVQATTEAS